MTAKKLKPRKCKQCGIKFLPKTGKQEYCSLAHTKRWFRITKWYKRICPECNTIFKTKIKLKKFCKRNHATYFWAKQSGYEQSRALAMKMKRATERMRGGAKLFTKNKAVKNETCKKHNKEMKCGICAACAFENGDFLA